MFLAKRTKWQDGLLDVKGLKRVEVKSIEHAWFEQVQHQVLNHIFAHLVFYLPWPSLYTHKGYLSLKILILR